MKDNNSEAELLGRKLKFLRKHWGFKRRKDLIENKKWLDVVGCGFSLSREDNIGKFERGDRILKQEHIEQICEIFVIPADLMQDNIPFEIFQEKIKTIRKSQTKGSDYNGFVRNDNHNNSAIIVNMRNYSKIWEKGGCSYDIIENYGKDLKLFTTTHQKIWDNENLSNTELAFILMVSIHFNAGWEKWVPLNIQNEIALSSLFIGLHVNYWRTRFRILYSLQFFDPVDVKKELKTTKNLELSEKTVDAINNHVFSKQIVQFLRSVANTSPEYISTKAKSVLAEIAARWNDEQVDDTIPL